MKTLSFLSLFAIVMAISSCSDDVVAPKASPIVIPVIKFEQSAVPLDCPSWLVSESNPTNSRPNYSGFQPWAHAVSRSLNSTGKIEIDYFVLKDEATGQVVDSLGYNQDYATLTTNQGGNYGRWYPPGNKSKALEAKEAMVANGLLSLNLAGDLLAHFWMNDQGRYPRSTANKYYIEVRLRISGDAAIQFGADYYLTPASDWPDNIEAWHSAWLGNTNGEFITRRYPAAQ
jgi:hypothetical protein